ncbi:MAG TPA: NAD(P)H-dependent glycerol-3-phosphate dehydrogenase [Candidatus Cloacimonadota bacterium]|nr:NAD(P)H-dependent glycerol-3-phosphate dehydrogenase [Candidatus Cloacimonadota bacterium]HOQ79604.1 NAD(P)H-dependent glycerol-3-phosphate dehydrogenase [Candidatus Cloacimonadota bacterium]
MKVYVLGAGNWGTTLATVFAEKNQIVLWTNTTEEADQINKDRENRQFLPGIMLPDNISAEKKYNSRLNSDDILIVSVPSRKVHEICEEIKAQGYTQPIYVNVSKGVEHKSLKTIHEIVKDFIPKVHFANLSGPTIAREIAEGLPAKAVLASDDIELLFYLQKELANSRLFFEFSTDVKGIELAASLKGLIAIAIGIADGLGYKTNIFGLLMTKGLSEFYKLMKFFNVNPKTVYGIAGMGDLITTCLSENSRNRQFGKLLAQGLDVDSALQKVGMEVEGVSMAKTVMKLTRLNISLPLISFVVDTINGEADLRKDLEEVLLKMPV